MVILHVAKITDDLCSGVCVAVPQHIVAQQKVATVAFVNITNVRIAGVKNQFDYRKDFSIDKLPTPFSKPKLVVFHEIYIPAFAKIVLELIHKKIPYVIVPHGSLSVEAQNKKHLKKTVANILFFNYYVKKSVGVQCLSQREFENIRFKANKFIGTNGIGVPVEKKQEFRNDKLTMLFIGRYEVRIKGIDLLIPAVKKNEDLFRKNNVHLCMYGPDIEGGYDEIKALVSKYGVDELISVNSSVTGEEKKQKLLEADLFVQTSRTEGMPMGILEALSFGLPCVVTYGTNVAGLIEQNGAGYACETTVDGISEALKKAVEERETFKNKSINATDLIDKHFRWDSVVDKILQEYHRILGDCK